MHICLIILCIFLFDIFGLQLAGLLSFIEFLNDLELRGGD